MNKILKTHLYNSFYYDYSRKLPKTDHFLSDIHNISWKDIVHLMDSGTEHYLRIKSILAKQNADLNSEKAKYYIQQLSDPGSVIIITGQQLGIFGSPLYTIYKLITTIKLAESMNKQKMGKSFIPVFWLESEDHDFQEICRVGLLDKHFSPEQVKYDGQDRGKVSMRHYQLEPAIQSFVSKILENLLETEFTSALFTGIENIYSPGTGWVTAAREYLKSIFQSSGLLFFQPGDEEIKQISVDFFERLLTENENVSAAFRENSETLEEAGYHNQVKNIPGKTFIHIEDEKQQRSHLYREGKNYNLKESGNSYTFDEARQFIRNHPLTLSTSVVSRPLLQSWLLPVAAYVAGPAEIAYWAQLRKIFSYFELFMPMLYPRISATLLEPKIARYLDKHLPDTENIPLKKRSFIERYYKDLRAGGEEDPLKKIENTLQNEGSKLGKYLNQLDPTLVDASNKTIERMKQNLANLENRVIKAREQKDNQLTGHLNQIHTAFFPEEIPQERYLSVIYFLNKFGPHFIDDLSINLEINNFEHQIVFI